MLWQKGSIKQEKEYRKVFSFGSMSCTLSNCEGIKLSQNEDVETDKLINYPSEAHSNLISKVFEIRFPHHTVTLRDDLLVAYLPHLPAALLTHPIKNDRNEESAEAARPDQNKKLVLFRSKLSRDASQIKGDKKNIAKNVVTAFMNYLRDQKHEGQNYQSQVETLKGLIEKTKYNNQLITLIISNPELRPYFSQFLGSYAAGWVQHSKLKNKEIHIEAIELYERLCEEKESKFREHEHKGRMEVEPQNDQNEYFFQSAINHELEDEIKDFK